MASINKMGKLGEIKYLGKQGFKGNIYYFLNWEIWELEKNKGRIWYCLREEREKERRTQGRRRREGVRRRKKRKMGGFGEFVSGFCKMG